VEARAGPAGHGEGPYTAPVDPVLVLILLAVGLAAVLLVRFAEAHNAERHETAAERSVEPPNSDGSESGAEHAVPGEVATADPSVEESASETDGGEPLPAVPEDPTSFEEFFGQPRAVAILRDSVDSALRGGMAMGHILLVGPRGVGKRTLATTVAYELGVGIHTTSGRELAQPGDLAAILTLLDERDVLFIDEIHRLNHSVEEILYPAMEDYAIDVMIGKGPSARSLRLGLRPFTLIGTTPDPSLIDAVLLGAFLSILSFGPYAESALVAIVEAYAVRHGVPLEPGAANSVARAAGGSPEAARRIVRWAAREAVALELDVLSIAAVDAVVSRRGLESAVVGGGPLRGRIWGGSGASSRRSWASPDPPSSEVLGLALEERVVAALHGQGWNVETTARSHDGGIDFVARRADALGVVVTLYGQCKNYDRPIGVAVIRELLGSVPDGRGNIPVIVAPAGLTTEAQAFAADRHVVVWTEVDIAGLEASDS
jgi:holliday junction DNA helicase RuvB